MKKLTTIALRYSRLWPAGRLFLLFLLVCTLSSSAFAQTGRITGKITNAQGEPLPGVTVRAGSNAVTTDAEGFYSIDVVPGDSLQISYVGFRSVSRLVAAGESLVNLSLEPQENTLGDVVVVGYTSQRKNTITGSVSTVNLNSISKTRIPEVGQMLQGQVPGVFVAANTGAPGDGFKLRIRGEGTLGNNDALYIVDGVPTRDIRFLNGNDIASMTVLKDAASAAIYGSRAAAGVVVITTRSGQKGRTSIDLDYFTGFYNAVNLPKMLNTDQYLTVKDMAWHNTLGNAPGATSPYQADRSRPDLANTNWLDELFTTGVANSIQLSASGGTDKVQFLLSAGYFGQNGIVVEKNDGFERYNFRVNVNANLTERLRIGTNLNLSYSKQDKLSSSGDVPGVIRHAMIRPPVLGVYKDPSDPTYNPANPYTDLPFYTGNNSGWSKNYEYSSNPLAIVHFTDDKRKTFQTFGNVYGEYAFLRDKSLRFRTNVGVDISFAHNKNFAENFGDDNDNDPAELYPGLGRNNKPNNLDENYGDVMTFTFTNTLNYLKTINDRHSLNVLLGTENISSRTTGIGGSRQNFDNSTDPFRYLDYGSDVNKSSAGSASEWNLVSFFASASYSLDNKYLLSGTMRADGSSRFGPNNKWGYFPSVSAGWRISQESFLQDVSWLSDLKLRASWGQAGNQEIPDHAYETLVTRVGGVVNTIRYGNPDIKWETTTQTDVGFDMALLNNRLTITADYFNKKTDDILLSVGLPAVSVGVIQSTYVNAGEVTNKGFELGIGYQNRDHAFKYSVNGNLSTVTNRVNKLQEFVKNINDDATRTRTVAGQPISSYYGLQFEGIYQNAGEITKQLYANANGALPGDIRFKDVNGDGQINADDRVFIGNPVPKYTFGLFFNAEFKNFDFSFLVQGVQDVDRYNDLKQILNYDSRPFNSTTAVLESWHGEGTSYTTPRVTFNNNGGGNVSSVFVEDASYVRLKNIELGYNVNLKSGSIKGLRFYVSAQNLVTITHYTGLDPESTSLIDKGTYPLSRGVLAGVRMKL
ncbi:MAG: TonB-dependent receptor [Chitinophagaceae bacterium]